MNHVVNISGGLSSAVAADRVLQRFPDAILWFADTMWEDEDLYRFLEDLQGRWGRTIIRYQDGRTPLECAAHRHIIPDSIHAPCSQELKARPGEKFRESVGRPATFYLGYSWSEMHRVRKMQERYAGIEGVTVDFPLLWAPIETRPAAEIVREWGIEIPRLYQLGFQHNNCGGRCVRQGIPQWLNLLRVFPERYAEVENWEQEQRAQGGSRANRTIARIYQKGERVPITLRDLRLRTEELAEQQPTLIDDQTECLCPII